mmetsp:Transcript_8740/g.15078  ORF Transcript_8740/g.15078 Transcript_8740/m.15078 type:complete len:92 (+) Transcript_8740:194-469(+)
MILERTEKRNLDQSRFEDRSTANKASTILGGSLLFAQLDQSGRVNHLQILSTKAFYRKMTGSNIHNPASSRQKLLGKKVKCQKVFTKPCFI